MLKTVAAPTVAVLMLVCGAAPAAAQGLARGVVLSVTGAPVPGATVTAVQPEVSARTFRAVTDEDGAWVMIGMTVGPWEFSAAAEGFGTRGLDIEVRASTPPVTFVLEPDVLSAEGRLPPDVLLQVDAASQLRRAGDLGAAAEAFEALRTELPTLTMIDMVLADIYRRQAAGETNADDRADYLRRAEEAEARLAAVTP
jgi:hypothetical protein